MTEVGRWDICTDNCQANERATRDVWVVPDLFHEVCKEWKATFHLVDHLVGLSGGVIESDSGSVMSDFLWPHRLEPTKILGPWNSPGKNSRVDTHSLLQGIFLTKGLNPDLLHCRWILYHLSQEEWLLGVILKEWLDMDNSKHGIAIKFWKQKSKWMSLNSKDLRNQWEAINSHHGGGQGGGRLRNWKDQIHLKIEDICSKEHTWHPNFSFKNAIPTERISAPWRNTVGPYFSKEALKD